MLWYDIGKELLGISLSPFHSALAHKHTHKHITHTHIHHSKKDTIMVLKRVAKI